MRLLRPPRETGENAGGPCSRCSFGATGIFGKAHGGAENVVIGVDDAKRLWVFRVIPGDEGVSWFYQSTPVVRARACFGHVGPDDDRLGILLKTASGSTHWVLPGAVSWDDNENWW